MGNPAAPLEVTIDHHPDPGDAHPVAPRPVLKFVAQAVPGSDRPPAVGTPDGGANRAAPEAAAAENRGPAAGADLGCPAPDQLAKVEECDQILEEVELGYPKVGQGLDPAQLERLRARLVSIRVRALRMEERLPAPA